MDAAGEVAELDDRPLHLLVCVADESARSLGIRLELFQRPAEIDAEREQPLLRAVVQVAFDLTAIGDRHVDGAGLRLA